MLRQRALLTPCNLLQLNNSFSFTINVSSLPLPDVEELKPRPHQTGGEEHQVHELLIQLPHGSGVASTFVSPVLRPPSSTASTRSAWTWGGAVTAPHLPSTL